MTTTPSSSPVFFASRKIRHSPTRKFHHQDESNFEDFSLVWLDDSRDVDDIDNEFRCVINYVKTFRNIERCVKYVLSVKSEKIFLVTSDKLSKVVIPRVHDHAQLEHIYIYCHRRPPRDTSLDTYNKLSGVFSDNQSLISRLRQDHQLSVQNLCSTSLLTLQQSTNKFEMHKSTVNWFPLLIETIIRTPQSDSMRRDLLTKCELDYIDNEIEQKSIEDFRLSYKATEAVAWLKRDCCIYRLLNKAFRSENVVTLFKLRCFVADLYRQLEELNEDYVKQLPVDQKHLHFCRGQGVSSDELNRLRTSVGQVISINHFFWTTTNVETATDAARHNEQNAAVEPILFEIIVSRSLAKSVKPFAPINNDKDETEILFSAGSLFQNESIEQSGKLWHVRLRLIDEKQTSEMKQMTQLMKRAHSDSCSLTALSNFLWKVGRYKEAESIFKILFDELRSFDSNQVSSIYNDIALLYNDRGSYNDALDYFEKSLKFAKKNRSSNAARIGRVSSHIGSIYANRRKYADALKYLKEAIQMQLEIKDPNPSDMIDLAESYAHVGYVYAEMRLFSQSLINSERALEMRQKQLSMDHPHVAQSYNSIGYVYFLQGFVRKALKYYEMALEINLASSDTNAVDLVKTYQNIGAAQFAEQKYSLAIENYEKAIDIGNESLPKDHPAFVQLFQSIAHAHKTMKNYALTLKYFRKALDIERSRSKQNHALLLELYTHVGVSYESLGKNSMALSHYKTGFQHGLKMKNRNFSRINTVQNSIQRCLNRAEQPGRNSTKKR